MGVSAKQFEQMRQRVAKAGGRGVGAKAPAELVAAAPRHRMILGVDPSLRGTGYGIIEVSATGPRSLAFGTIKCAPAWERSRCLLKIAQTLREVLQSHQPTACVVEGLFYAQNLQTALIMGEARGASLVAAAEAGLEIFEIAPRKMKQAMVGYGAAQKHAVGKMVQRMLGLDEPPSADAADALGLALAFAMESGRYALSQPKRV